MAKKKSKQAAKKAKSPAPAKTAAPAKGTPPGESTVPAEKKEYSAETLADYALLERGASEILPREEMLAKLERSRKTKKPLRVKAGFDPTAPDLHLGHTVLIRKLKHFQDLGHEVIFLIGDFTGMIGDPTGRSATRKRLSAEEVKANAKSYTDQVFKILDEKKTRVEFNSKWCAKMKFEDVLALTARYTVARMVERDDFSKRLAAQESISLVEFMYPLVQGYDSVALESDVELGGTDQKFNLLVGRELQKEYGQEPQAILTMPLLVGLEGVRKMSKSYDNYVGINETPYDMFAKIMSISDDLMWNYYLLLTDVPEEKIEELKQAPFDAKKKLGELVVDDFHSAGSGARARKQWETEKSEKRNEMVLPPDTPEYKITEPTPCKIQLAAIVADAGLEQSKGAVRRLIKSGAVKLGQNLETVKEETFELEFPGEYQVRVGKKKYLVIKG